MSQAAVSWHSSCSVYTAFTKMGVILNNGWTWRNVYTHMVHTWYVLWATGNLPYYIPGNTLCKVPMLQRWIVVNPPLSAIAECSYSWTTTAEWQNPRDEHLSLLPWCWGQCTSYNSLPGTRRGGSWCIRIVRQLSTVWSGLLLVIVFWLEI